MTRSLYNIKNEYLEIVDTLINAGGEVDENLETQLAINREELEVKATNYALIIQDFKGREEIIDKEIARLAELKKGLTSARTKLSDNILEAMQLYEIDKVKGDLISLAVHKSPDSVEIEDESLIPVHLKKHKPETYTPDKVAIKAQLQNGNTVFGATLITGKKRLSIK